MSNQILLKTKSGETVYLEIAATPVSRGSTGVLDLRAAEPPRAGGSPTLDDYDPEIAPKGDIAKSMGAADKVLQAGVFERVVGVVRELVEDVGGGLMHCQPPPAQVELELSLGIGASGHVVIFKGDANATFKLKMTWKSPSP